MRNTILDAIICDGPNQGRTLGECLLWPDVAEKPEVVPFMSEETSDRIQRLADRIRSGEFGDFKSGKRENRP